MVSFLRPATKVPLRCFEPCASGALAALLWAAALSTTTTVWRKTLEEVDKGWLQGPLPRCSVPGDQPICRRFGLLQKKDKVRLIDDFSESGVNSTVTSVESPVLHTIDVACAVLAFWFSLCNEGGVDPRLVVRTFDLTSAYRQVGLCQAGREFACIRVF